MANLQEILPNEKLAEVSHDDNATQKPGEEYQPGTQMLYGLEDLFGEVRVNHGDPAEDFIWEWPSDGLKPHTTQSVEDESTNEPVKLVLHCPDSTVELMAQYVWQSSISLANQIARGRIQCKNKHVIELGAGAGLPGMACALMNAASVVITDYPEEEIVANLKRNVGDNSNVLPTGSCDVLGHKWATPPDDSTWPRTKFDLIIMADTLWMEHQHENLVTSLDMLLSDHPDSRIVSTFMHHDDRESVAPAFLELAKKFFEVESHVQLDWRSNDKEEPLGGTDGQPDDPEEYGFVYQVVYKRKASQQQ